MRITVACDEVTVNAGIQEVDSILFIQVDRIGVCSAVSLSVTFTKWLPSAVRSRSVRASGSSADDDEDGSSEEVSSLRGERESTGQDRIAEDTVKCMKVVFDMSTIA